MNMAAGCLLLLAVACTVSAAVNGYTLEAARVRREAGDPTDEECMRPPMKRLAHECCRLPRERIWGDLRDSLNTCIRKLKHDKRLMRQEMAYDDAGNPTEAPRPPADASSDPIHHHHRKNSYHHHHRRNPNDSCFMECVFEDQGFIMGKMVNKAALLERLNKTLGRNEIWHSVAVAAVETCHENELEAPSNGSCRSGSEEIFRCVFKHIFFNCPNWPVKNEYCTALREFYQKCPYGPPPEVNDNHSTMPPDVEEETDTNPATERYTSK